MCVSFSVLEWNLLPRGTLLELVRNMKLDLFYKLLIFPENTKHNSPKCYRFKLFQRYAVILKNLWM